MAIGTPGPPLLRDAIWRLSRRHGAFIVAGGKPPPAVVLERDVTLLINPIALRMAVLVVLAITAFGWGLFTIRLLRKNLESESESLNSSPLAAEGLPVHAYHAVIQQLKQQKHELATQQLSERRKAKASDTLSSTILSNLSCGVLFLNSAGLVRQATAPTRKHLRFSSPVGLHAADRFRTTTVRPENNDSSCRLSVHEALPP